MRLVRVCALVLGFLSLWGIGAATAAPSAVIDRVRLAPRAESNVRAWQTSEDTYRGQYVYPATRIVQLNGCSSLSNRAVSSSGPPNFLWTLEPLEQQPGAQPIQVRADFETCGTTAAVPAMGRWRITLTTSDQAGLTATTTREVEFRDLLVAAIGDSFASGEGNPPWVDGQCHRSRKDAWPLLVAKALENDSTTVTFVSFACSGASIENLVDKGYVGMRRPATADRLRPQLVALRRLLGDPALPTTRTVDLLLGAAGINALSAGATLTDCAADRFSGGPLAFLNLFLADCRRDFSEAFARLPGLYDDLELAIGTNLRVAQFQVLGYPARLLTDGGDDYRNKLTGFTCGPICKVAALACFPFEDLRVDGKQFITRSVETVNDVIGEAARRSEWWRLTRTLDRFRNHGYCTVIRGKSYFRGTLASIGLQGNPDGTAHPNQSGHRAAASEVLKVVTRNAEPPDTDTFVVKILKLRLKVVDDSERPPAERWRHGLVRAEIPGATKVECRAATPAPDVPDGQCRVFAVETSSRTVAVSAHVPVTRFVPRKPPIPGEPGAGHGVLSDLLARRLHRRGSNWNIGTRHEITVRGAAGTLELEYTITPEDRGPVVGPS